MHHVNHKTRPLVMPALNRLLHRISPGRHLKRTGVSFKKESLSTTANHSHTHTHTHTHTYTHILLQPTHPAFYERDERQFTCNVCKSEFSVKPPSRAEMMAQFTGPELAALLDTGCLIVCEPKTSQYMGTSGNCSHHTYFLSGQRIDWLLPHSQCHTVNSSCGCASVCTAFISQRWLTHLHVLFLSLSLSLSLLVCSGGTATQRTHSAGERHAQLG